MLKKRFWVVPLTALIVVGLLILSGFAIHRIGWLQGYRIGQSAIGGEGGAVVPYAPYGFGRPGLLFTIGVLFLLLIVVGKFFRFWAWKMAGSPWTMASGPKRAPWTWHWHHPHAPMPPWCWGWEKPPEEKAEQAEPGAETGAAEA